MFNNDTSWDGRRDQVRLDEAVPGHSEEDQRQALGTLPHKTVGGVHVMMCPGPDWVSAMISLPEPTAIAIIARKPADMLAALEDVLAGESGTCESYLFHPSVKNNTVTLERDFLLVELSVGVVRHLHDALAHVLVDPVYKAYSSKLRLSRPGFARTRVLRFNGRAGFRSAIAPHQTLLCFFWIVLPGFCLVWFVLPDDRDDTFVLPCTRPRSPCLDDRACLSRIFSSSASAAQSPSGIARSAAIHCRTRRASSAPSALASSVCQRVP